MKRKCCKFAGCKLEIFLVFLNNYPAWCALHKGLSLVVLVCGVHVCMCVCMYETKKFSFTHLLVKYL